jgi:hypothetical protein
MSRAFTEQVLRLGTVFRIQIAEPKLITAVRVEWNKALNIGDIIIYAEPTKQDIIRISGPTEKTRADIEWPTTNKATQGCPSRMD